MDSDIFLVMLEFQNFSFMEDIISDQWDICFLNRRLYTMPGMRIVVANTYDCILEERILTFEQWKIRKCFNNNNNRALGYNVTVLQHNLA